MTSRHQTDFIDSFHEFANNRDAFSRIFVLVKQRINQFHLENHLSVDEVIAEAYLRGIQYLEKDPINNIENIPSWLTRVSFNIIAEKLRDARRKDRETRAWESIEDSKKLQAALSLSDDDYSQLNKALGKISANERRLLTLRYFEELSWKEIAFLLNEEENTTYSKATFRKRGERALHRLRAEYKKLQKDKLLLSIQASDYSPTNEVAEELATLCKALNAYHIACGGNGLEIDDWQIFVAIRAFAGV